MKIYAIGYMSKGAFVAVAGALGLRDAAQTESMLRLQGRRGMKIAEMESVATFSVKDGLNYERVLTPRAQERIRLGEYVDGEGLIQFAVGLIGVPYVEEVETDWLTDMFFGTAFYPTLRKAWTARTAEVNGAGEEDPWDYRVFEMRVLAWVSIDENMTVVRTPIGPETTLEDEYVRRREPLPPPPEETYDGSAPPIDGETYGEAPVSVEKPRGFLSRLLDKLAA